MPLNTSCKIPYEDINNIAKNYQDKYAPDSFLTNISDKVSFFSHHGEILQGVFYGNTNKLHKGLITLPCPLFHSKAQFFPREDNLLTCSIPSKWKAIKAVQLIIDKFKCKHKGGHLVLKSNIPISWGLGSSTCDVVASIYAVAKSYNIELDKYTVAKLAIETEVASDSTMFTKEIILFAQRKGVALEEFEGKFPPLLILGFNSDPELNGIDTLSIPEIRYSSSEKEIFNNLLSVFRIALKKQDPKLIGRVSTTSALINQNYLPKPQFNTILAIANNSDSVGIQVSHSGTVMGILFDATDSLLEPKLNSAKKALSSIGIKKTYTFNIPLDT